MEYFPTNRAGTKLVFEGREYHKRKKYVNGNTFWQCSNSKKCKGNVTISTESVKIKENPHSLYCLSNTAKCKIREKMLQLKQRVCDNYDPIQKQFEDVICQLKDDGVDLLDVELPKFENIKSGLYKARNRQLQVPSLHCKLAIDVKVPEKFNKILLADYNDEIRILIFCLPAIESILYKIDIYLLDGTFKACPPPFKQIYSIHGYNADTKNVFPLFFAFLENKKQKTYELLFDIIKSRFPTWRPSQMLIDYEKSAINAIRKKFPNTILKGCYYHFCRSIFKKAKNLGIKSRVQRRHVARCAGLARLPLRYITSGYQYIMKKSPKTEPVQKFNTYFDRFWFHNIKFIKMWCCNEEEIRNTNYVEGWHSRLNRYVGIKNPSIAKVLDILQKEFKIKNITGKAKTRKDNIYKEIDEEINSTIEDLKEKTISVGHCIEIIAPFVL